MAFGNVGWAMPPTSGSLVNLRPIVAATISAGLVFSTAALAGKPDIPPDHQRPKTVAAAPPVGAHRLPLDDGKFPASPLPTPAKPTPKPTKVTKKANPKPPVARSAPVKPRPAYTRPARTRIPAARPPVTGSPKAYARSLVGDAQFACLEPLWTHESGWRWNAQNPSSGAYGIPQALPGSKMASAGADWRTNPQTQIRWGISYIKARYGTPCGAWSHFQSTNWY